MFIKKKLLLKPVVKKRSFQHPCYVFSASISTESTSRTREKGREMNQNTRFQRFYSRERKKLYHLPDQFCLFFGNQMHWKCEPNAHLSNAELWTVNNLPYVRMMCVPGKIIVQLDFVALPICASYRSSRQRFQHFEQHHTRVRRKHEHSTSRNSTYEG